MKKIFALSAVAAMALTLGLRRRDEQHDDDRDQQHGRPNDSFGGDTLGNDTIGNDATVLGSNSADGNAAGNTL